MHWYGDGWASAESRDNFKHQDILWFFSHEIAHLFQGEAARFINQENSWIHEGSAEFMASISLSSLLDESSAYVSEKLKTAKQQCVDQLGEHSLFGSAERMKFKLYYSCGILISQAIDSEVRKISAVQDIFTIWQSFQKGVARGEPASKETFLKILKPHVSKRFYKNLEKAVSPLYENSIKYLKEIIIL
jgi:predicted metalloprotease with PDZ domain